MAQEVNERMYGLGAEPSAIRELYAYGLARKAEIGADKVFDFSLGNPSVPAPASVKEAILELLEEPAEQLHAYTPAQGRVQCRQAIADNIRKRFGMPATADKIYLTVGAAASLSIAISAVTQPGEEVMVVAPFFPEYRVYIETAQCSCVEVLSRESDLQLDIPAMAAAMTPRTRAVILNSPNNPTGGVLTKGSLEALAELLKAKEAEYGHAIYVICDEPYREITYGADIPYLPLIYARTLVCYSWSKSLSLPGERIGYVYVSDSMDNADEVYTAVCGAGRALGYVCAPVLFQRVIEKCIDEPSDVAAYAENRRLLTEGLSSCGYEYLEPEGAFYLWVKSLGPDAKAFSDRAKEHELLIVASDSFGMPGWVRIGYCVGRDVIVNAMPAFKALKESYES